MQKTKIHKVRLTEKQYESLKILKSYESGSATIEKQVEDQAKEIERLKGENEKLTRIITDQLTNR